jgi:hypothetical protein
VNDRRGAFGKVMRLAWTGRARRAGGWISGARTRKERSARRVSTDGARDIVNCRRGSGDRVLEGRRLQMGTSFSSGLSALKSGVPQRCNSKNNSATSAKSKYRRNQKSLFNRTKRTHVISRTHTKMRRMRPIALISSGRPILVVIVCSVQ